MTSRERKDLPEWEAQFNALLDGELDKASSDALKQAASEDHELARAIIEAWQLQRGMDQLEIDRAPASLRRKLRRIPRSHRHIHWPRRRVMAAALAAVPLLTIGLLLVQPHPPSQADVEQARQDLAVAFSYIDKVGDRAGDRIYRVLGSELHHSVSKNISRHIPYPKHFRKDKQS